MAEGLDRQFVSRICRLCFLVAFGIIQLVRVHGQDVVALNSYQKGIMSPVNMDRPQLSLTTQQLTFDATKLGEGSGFYDRDSLTIKLGDDSIKTFRKVLGNSGTNQHFVGESDTGDSLQLMKYVSPATGWEILMGSLVDLDTKLVYQFRQSIEGITLTASVTPSEDIPMGAEPPQLNSTILAKLKAHHEHADKAFFSDPMNQVPSASTDDDVKTNIVTLMIVWSKRSECMYSTGTEDCQVTAETEEYMRALIEAEVAETNAAYTMSNIDFQHKLVHAYRHPTYDESTLYDPLNLGALNTTLALITFPWDGQLDDVPGLRRKYKADMVSMIIDEKVPDFCGIAWLGTLYFPVPSAATMYNVVGWTCLTGTFVLAHELGHNFGCSHDRGTDNMCDSWWFYHAHGWRDPTAKFRTIMAYNCEPNQCDSSPGTSCPTIPRFSDSKATYFGSPLGDARNDCSRQLRRYGGTVSRFSKKPSLCFAPQMTVQVEGQSEVVQVKDLKVGDRVLTAATSGVLSFQTIYSINHYHRTRPTEFLQLHVMSTNGENAQPSTLELSEYHLIVVRGHEHPIPAGRIRVGDHVQVVVPSTQSRQNATWSAVPPYGKLNMGSPERVFARLADVKTVVRRGFYNPLTTDGMILVNNVVASTYSSLLAVSPMMGHENSVVTLDEECIWVGRWKILSQQRFLHLMTTPYRALSLLQLGTPYGLGWHNNTDELELQEYLSPYCSWGIGFASWWQRQTDGIQVIVLLMLLIVFGTMDAFASDVTTSLMLCLSLTMLAGILRISYRVPRVQSKRCFARKGR